MSAPSRKLGKASEANAATAAIERIRHRLGDVQIGGLFDQMVGPPIARADAER